MMDNWMGPAGFGLEYGLIHWLVFAVIVAVFLYPVGQILTA